MSENKRKAGQYTAKEIYLLSGLIFCGECGGSMCGNIRTNGRRSGNYASYRCSGRHNKQGCHNREIRRYYIDVYDEKVEVIFKVNFFDKETGKIAPMKSEETLQNLRLEYQDVEKGSAGIVPEKRREFERNIA